ncbi:hypothetical protein A2U01_0024898, partial [Trifolium medium]|nr:hypothetical protein [Trifolium medium]
EEILKLGRVRVEANSCNPIGISRKVTRLIIVEQKGCSLPQTYSL